MVELTAIAGGKRKASTPKFPKGFEVGAIVKLKSGGSVMVITHLLGGDLLEAQCVWHDAQFLSQEISYPVACLRIARQDEVSDVNDTEGDE